MARSIPEQNRLVRERLREFLMPETAARETQRKQSAQEIIASQGGVTATLRALGLQPAGRKTAEGREYLAVRRALERYATGQQAPTPRYLRLLEPLGTEQQRIKAEAAIAAKGTPRKRLAALLAEGGRLRMDAKGKIEISADPRRERALWAEIDEEDLDEFEANPIATFQDRKGFEQGSEFDDLEEVSFSWA